MKHGPGLYLFKNGNILIGNFLNGEIEGLSLIISKVSPIQICFMNNSKVKVLVTDENEKNNIKISSEYKKLLEFYESNKNHIQKFV